MGSSVQRVVVVGSLNMDLGVEAPHIPSPGETVLGGALRTAGGGKGANQAVAAARLGAGVSMVGCVGDDDYGRQLLARLADDDVDVRAIRVVASPTGIAIIVVEPAGENAIVVAPGANDCVAPSDVARAPIGTADVVVSQLEIPLETVRAAAATARASNTPFLLNAAPARSLCGELLRMVDVLVVNETELGAIAGARIAPGDEAAPARELLQQGVGAVVVTLGGRGALVVSPAGSTPVAAFRIVPVDTTAAGDAFVGALAARYRGPESLVAGAQYASAAAALACTRAGAQPSLPGSDEVETFLSRVVPEPGRVAPRSRV